MSEIAGIPSKLTWEGAGPEVAKAKNTMGKDDFMKLLMTQLRYQDPMKPMDHEQFVAQLAQFGSLEQLANIGAGIQNLKTGMGEGAKLQALGMIGKDVQASGGDLEMKEGIPVAICLPKSNDLTPIKATVFDSNGAVVRELDLDGKKEGAIEWDGKSQDGTALPAGKYSFRVHGVGQNGQTREIGTELSGRVVGVQMEGQLPMLLVQTPAGVQKVEIAKVGSVKLAETSDPGGPRGNPMPMNASLPVSAPSAPPVNLEPPKVENPEEALAEQETLMSGGHAPDFASLMAGVR